ncbi:MAG TPA: MopE-related protein [Chitinophagales bacterium]|nr:MopE-related protein [Chitinophagales bacterium]HRG85830.1 MopE-related protein [Chitinophagales bacterium]HRH53324.1 MopE-related protein [Chitinophagales bacterium]
MKFLHLILMQIISTIIAQAQALEVEWEKSFGGIIYEEAFDIIATADSNFLVVGRGGPLAADFFDCGEYTGFVIVKITSAGEILWSKCYGGNEYSLAHAIINSSEGGYVVAGETYASDGDITGAHGNSDFWVIKISDTGELEWQLAVGGTSHDRASDIIQSNDGSYLVVGDSRSINGDINDHHGTESTSDLLLAKINIGGELIWTNSYGGIYDDTGYSIVLDDSENLILIGYSASTGGDVPENKGSTDLWVLKVNTDGEIIWSKTFGGSETDIGYSMSIMENSIFLVGTTFSNNFDVSGNHGFQDGWVLKLNQDGDFISQKCFGGSNFEIFDDIYTINSSTILLTGASGSINGDLTEHFGAIGYADWWAVKVDTNLNLVFQKSLGGSLNDRAYAGLFLDENQFIITGTSYSSDGYVSENGGGSDMWTVKLNVCYDKYFADTDGDGFGDLTDDSISCNMPAGYVFDSTDCNDLNPDIHPTLTDICNSIDDNCNGLFDEDATFTTYYLDADADLFGATGTDSISCSVVVGYVENSFDCNDLNAEINPLIIETCNGIDDNCNVAIDEGLTLYTFFADVDGDTYGNPDAGIDTCLETVFGYVSNNLDCNDTLATIYPGATELCNYLDDDCDGLVDDNVAFIQSYADIDSDNFGNILIDSISCELPEGYVLDNTDCDDTNPDIYPGATELLNGLDDDCDQVADEGLSIENIKNIICSISPNPSFDVINITSNILGSGEFEFVSSIGQILFTGEWDANNNSISIIKLPAGVYTIRLSFNNTVASLPFIKIN